MSSLKEYVSVDQTECLNEDIRFPVKNLFNGNTFTCLRSDCDPQLLISVPFTCPVKLNGIRFHFMEDSQKESVPSEIRIFTNQGSLDFGDAESLVPVQTLHKTDLVHEKTVPLKFVLFQNVFSVQLFVVDNCGGAYSEITGIDFFGTPAENMNMRM